MGRGPGGPGAMMPGEKAKDFKGTLKTVSYTHLIPLDGIIIVTSPQELVSMIVAKAVNMAQMMNVPIVGIVENMSYVKCPDCGREIQILGESHVDQIAAKYGLKVLGKMPIDPEVAKNCDVGLVELVNGDWLDAAADAVEALK